MCCLFGILDYGNALTPSQKNHVLSVLSRACEVRGTDATGIAYNAKGSLCIYKRPLPAHYVRFHIPKGTSYIMGHTRLATQGNEHHNQNNHPFLGMASKMPFALAHNGVLNNDQELRKTKKLPVTTIETDSYVAVQLIERFGELSFECLKQMAEQVNGTFTFTLLDRNDNLYIVKGNNPLCLYHWPKLGLYLYASTEDLLKKALQGIRLKLGKPSEIDIDSGEILRIDRCGHITKGCFDDTHLYVLGSYSRYHWPYSFAYWGTSSSYDRYIDELKSVARSFGCSPEDIDSLLTDGFTPEEIEESLYCMEV